MENKRVDSSLEPLLKPGDFVRNKIHGYISFLYKKDMMNVLCFDGIIVDADTTAEQWAQYMQVGFVRSEHPNELEKVVATLPVISLTKGFLVNLTCVASEHRQLDNLSYIELLSKLTDQEQALKNENKL